MSSTVNKLSGSRGREWPPVVLMQHAMTYNGAHWQALSQVLSICQAI